VLSSGAAAGAIIGAPMEPSDAKESVAPGASATGGRVLSSGASAGALTVTVPSGEAGAEAENASMETAVVGLPCAQSQLGVRDVVCKTIPLSGTSPVG